MSAASWFWQVRSKLSESHDALWKAWHGGGREGQAPSPLLQILNSKNGIHFDSHDDQLGSIPSGHVVYSVLPATNRNTKSVGGTGFESNDQLKDEHYERDLMGDNWEAIPGPLPPHKSRRG